MALCVPEYGTGNVKSTTQVIVRAGQLAMVIKNQQALDILGPGCHSLTPETTPLLTKQMGRVLGPEDILPLQIFFVSTATASDCKWSTSPSDETPVLMGTQRVGRQFIRAFGTYEFFVDDPQKFFEAFRMTYQRTIVSDRLLSILRSCVANAVHEVCDKVNGDLLDILSQHQGEIGATMRTLAQEECRDLGINLKQVSFTYFNLAKNAEELLKAWERGLSITRKAESVEDSIDSSLVFVITAFQDDMEPVFARIQAAAAALNLVAKRVKDVPGDYRITDQIIKMIREARLIVADLTHERPNVYFELGYARGVGKTVITTVREGTNIHFDVKDWTYIPYNDMLSFENALRKRFQYELSRPSPSSRSSK